MCWFLPCSYKYVGVCVLSSTLCHIYFFFLDVLFFIAWFIFQSFPHYDCYSLKSMFNILGNILLVHSRLSGSRWISFLFPMLSATVFSEFQFCSGWQKPLVWKWARCLFLTHVFLFESSKSSLPFSYFNFKCNKSCLIYPVLYLPNLQCFLLYVYNIFLWLETESFKQKLFGANRKHFWCTYPAESHILPQYLPNTRT